MEPAFKKSKVDETGDGFLDKEMSMHCRTSVSAEFRSMVVNGGIMDYAARESLSSTASSAPSYSSHFQKPRVRKPGDVRITELLAENLKQKMDLEATKGPIFRKMEGDIPSLCLHSSFFVEGVRIGWPFPVIMPPQRQMALHLIKGLKNSRHVVLESPTGTGKSAAILCSVLAWQRHHHKMNSGRASTSQPTPRIIYCSRTHSQVAQMVASLRKTPYRPKMAVLGSRERLCIHQDIQTTDSHRDGSSTSRTTFNVNKECRIRVGNTETMRKRMWSSQTQFYDDDNPPEGIEMDTVEESEGGTVEWIDTKKKSVEKACCPHYRQLSSQRTAEMTYEQFVPQQTRITCCKRGGEKTRFGSHDIEDLVAFGKDPHVKRGVAVYRKSDKDSFGMIIARYGDKIKVQEIKPEGPVAIEGTIQTQDEILRVNGLDTKGKSVNDIALDMRKTKDPLLLDVTDESLLRADDGSGVSGHSACPYYLSRALAKHAELIFAPYNYVLDPFIRKSLDIQLSGAVVVLDEAHNVEDTLRESGSGRYGEIEICEIVVMLAYFSSMERSVSTQVDMGGNEGDEKGDSTELAHELLLFIEKIITFLLNAKTNFEQNPGGNGAKKVLADWQKYHTPDDTEFEMTYDGPNGYGVKGKSVGCQTFFDRLGATVTQAETLRKYGECLESHIRLNPSWAQDKYANLLDKMNGLLSKISFALQHPEHYYISSVAKANGSLEFAAGGLQGDRKNRFQRQPKDIPLIPPRSERTPHALAERCFHAACREVKDGPHYQEGGIRHGSYCNGARPPWETYLVLELLTPSLFMASIAKQCRSVILASGTLAPISSLCGELGLVGDIDVIEKIGTSTMPNEAATDENRVGRLQVQPKPLEANHVIDLEKQLLAISIGHFADGSPLTMNYANYRKPEFIPKLGDAIACVIESIPTGGVLVFLPSYSFLRKCLDNWNLNNRRRTGDMDIGEDTSDSIWERFVRSKGKVIVEPSGSQVEFESARDEYADTIRETGKCILLAVFRGKMSEGISFNDANARGVICVGIPFPNAYSRPITAKKLYNDEQRRLNKRTDILPGSDWYTQQAYRAIAQALGRCIRHAADYGTIILMDSRHCDDGAPVDDICPAHRSLPKWMRHHVRNLSRSRLGDTYGKSIPGGWRGLQSEMGRFFQHAPIHAKSVLEKQRESFQMVKASTSVPHGFDPKTGKWAPKQRSPRPIWQSSHDATDTDCLMHHKAVTSAQVSPTQGTPVLIDLSEEPNECCIIVNQDQFA